MLPSQCYDYTADPNLTPSTGLPASTGDATSTASTGIPISTDVPVPAVSRGIETTFGTIPIPSKSISRG